MRVVKFTNDNGDLICPICGCLLDGDCSIIDLSGGSEEPLGVACVDCCKKIDHDHKKREAFRSN